jgi:hypothetical protein
MEKVFPSGREICCLLEMLKFLNWGLLDEEVVFNVIGKIGKIRS